MWAIPSFLFSLLAAILQYLLLTEGSKPKTRTTDSLNSSKKPNKQAKNSETIISLKHKLRAWSHHYTLKSAELFRHAKLISCDKIPGFTPEPLREIDYTETHPEVHFQNVNYKSHKRIGFAGKEEEEEQFQVLSSKVQQNWLQVCFAQSSAFTLEMVRRHQEQEWPDMTSEQISQILKTSHAQRRGSQVPHGNQRFVYVWVFVITTKRKLYVYF